MSASSSGDGSLIEHQDAVPPELQAVWDRIPKMLDCKGMCHTSCGPVPVNGVEKKLAEARGKKFAVEDGSNGPMTCSLLTEGKQCSIYEIRPIMCRVWGATRSLPCPYGCTPERYLTDLEVFEILMEVAAISGDSEEAAMENMLEILGPELARIWHKEVGEPAKAAAQEIIETGKEFEWREATQ